MSNNDGIQPYKSIFSKNMKPLENINELVSSMGETAGVKSSDLNTKNQFKYINLMDYVNRDNISNIYDPNYTEVNRSIEEIDISTLLSEIRDDLINKEDPFIIGPKIKKLQDKLEKTIILDENIQKGILNLTKKSKSKTDSKRWAANVKRELNIFKRLIEDAQLSSDAQPAAAGVEETKGDETTGAGKYYYPKRFL